MSSRNRSEVVTLFDVFCEVGAGVSGASSMILQKYPEDFDQKQTLKSVAQFSFPCGVEDDDAEAVQLFSFVLTDEKSQYTYAFCRHTPRNNTCICILSGYPWAVVFYKILNHVSTIMNNRPVKELESFLTRAYHTAVLGPGNLLLLGSESGFDKLEIAIPDCSKLPTLKDDKFMLEFYNAVQEKQMIALYASLLKERRILFTGRKLSQLSSCIFAVSALLYPMQWQNLFIPVLPANLVDMLMAPMPYLIGVPKKTLKGLQRLELGDVVVIDLEDRTLETSHDDVGDLPLEVINCLRHQLRSSSDMFLSDGLARSFLRTNVLLFGGYRKGLSCSSYSYSWDREKFIQNQKLSLQSYLRSLLCQDGVQYLERFIDERIVALNSGCPLDDEFEKEIRLLEDKSSKVKENANDMFGLLKDKVHSITLKERLGKLTPKEIRRASSKKSFTSNENASFSFDTQQWIADANEHNFETSVLEASPVSCDLIDLNDEATLQETSKSQNNILSNKAEVSRSATSLTQTAEHFSSTYLSNFDPLATNSSTDNAEQNLINVPKFQEHWQRFD